MILKGKTAVITGCMQGIGKATMEVFAKEGANIFACCQIKDEVFEQETIRLAAENNVEIIPVYFDFTNDESMKAAVKLIMAAKKKIDILANIAGMTKDALFPMVTREQMQQVFNINFFSQIVFSQYIVKLMLRGGGGSIINTASITALDGNPGQLTYGAVKAAWVSATKTMAAELGASHIRVNAIAPGVIQTAMTDAVPADIKQIILNKTALGHIGTPEDVGNLIAWLGSDMASFVTGQIIRIDGGIG